MTTHSVKRLGSGEYSCSCGQVWDYEDGCECPAMPKAYPSIAAVDAPFKPGDLPEWECSHRGVEVPRKFLRRLADAMDRAPMHFDRDWIECRDIVRKLGEL